MPDKNATCGTSSGRYSSHNAQAGRVPSRCSRSSAASVSNVAITVATHAINSVVIIGPDSEGAAHSQLSRLTPSGHAAGNRHTPATELSASASNAVAATATANAIAPRPNRSEEHTSELQSLMRNSYAVLCLKKKN